MAEYSIEEMLTRLDTLQARGETQKAAALAQKLYQNFPQLNPGDSMNTSRGADVATRAVVAGSSGRPEDRLASIRGRYPEAMPYGDDNFSFIDRNTQQPTLFNPPGLDVGDIAEQGRMAANVIGGIGGGILSAPAAVASGPFAPAVGAAGVAAGATGAGYLYDQGMEYLAGSADSRSVDDQITDYGVEMGLNMIPFEKAVAPVSGALRMALRNGDQAIRDVVNKYSIQPTAGTVGGKFLQMAEASSQKIDTAVGSFQEAADRMFEGIRGVIGQFNDSLGGPIESIDAGRLVLQRAEDFFGRFRATRDAAYEEVDKLVPAGAKVGTANTNEYIESMLARFADSPALDRILTSKTLRDLQELGQFESYEALKNFRTKIGRMLSDKNSVGIDGLDQKEMTDLYRALSDDMMAGAGSFGEEAAAAAVRASEINAAGMKVQEEIIYPLMTSGKGGQYVEPLEVMRRLRGYAANAPDKLRRTLEEGVLSPDDMGRVGAGLLEDLGMATPGAQNVAGDALSPSRILTQTAENKIHAESRDLLFNKTAQEVMTDLRTLSRGVADVEQYVNRSNTATQGLGTMGGLAGIASVGAVDPVALAGGVIAGRVLPYVMSKGIQSQAFTDWLRKAPTQGSEQQFKTWVRNGARVASAEGLRNVYDGIVLSLPDWTRPETGVLEE